MATSITPRTCNANEVLRERKIRTWYASPNAAMLLLESEFESSFAPDIFDKAMLKVEYPFCLPIEGDDDEYEIISDVICLIQLKTLHVTSTNQDEETHKRLSTQGSWPGYSVQRMTSTDRYVPGDVVFH